MDANREVTTTPMPGSKSPRTAPRFEKLMATAAALMASHGFSDTSIRDVAQATGLSLGGLYYYFQNKEDLLFLIQEKTFSSLLELQENALENEPDPRRGLELLVCNHLEHFTTHFNELKVCTFELETLQGERFKIISNLRKRYFHTVEKVVAALENVDLSATTGDNRVRHRTLFIFGMLNWIFMWYNPARDGSPELVGQDMVELVLHGLGGNYSGETS